MCGVVLIGKARRDLSSVLDLPPLPMHPTQSQLRGARRAQHRRSVDRRARPLFEQIKALQARLIREEARRQLDAAGLVSIAKAITGADVSALLDLLLRFGEVQYTEAAQGMASRLGAEYSLTQSHMLQIVQAKEFKAKIYDAEIKGRVSEIIRSVQEEAASEFPQPNLTDLSLRMRRAVDAEIEISPARAEMWARSETNQNENLGILGGYQVAGVSEYGWVSILRNTRQGHAEMDGVRIPIGAKFAVPLYNAKGALLGVDMMVGPGDPTASAGNLVNCQCTTMPVR